MIFEEGKLYGYVCPQGAFGRCYTEIMEIEPMKIEPIKYIPATGPLDWYKKLVTDRVPPTVEPVTWTEPVKPNDPPVTLESLIQKLAEEAVKKAIQKHIVEKFSSEN